MSAIQSVQSANQIRMDFMKLLVAQMRNQDPLEPLSNNEMASQLAQFSQLEQLETMNASFSKVLLNTQLDYATSLIGKNVVFVNYGNEGAVEIQGTVAQVGIDGDKILLKVYEPVTGSDGSQMMREHVIGLDEVVVIGN